MRKGGETTDEARAVRAFAKLMRASEAVTARIHRHLAEAGITVSQFGVLEVVFHRGPMSQTEIAKKTQKSGGNVTLVIDNLERRGLVKRKRNSEDRRYYSVALTAKGQKLFAGLFPRHTARIIEEMNALTKGEQDELSRLCKKVGGEA